MEFIDKLVKMGYSEENAEKIYLFYQEFGSLGGLIDPEEYERNKELFD